MVEVAGSRPAGVILTKMCVCVISSHFTHFAHSLTTYLTASGDRTRVDAPEVWNVNQLGKYASRNGRGRKLWQIPNFRRWAIIKKKRIEVAK